MDITIETVLKTLVSDVGARPVGSRANTRTVNYLEQVALELGYETEMIEFDCWDWETGGDTGGSEIAIDGIAYPICPGPFSPPVRGVHSVVVVSTAADLDRLRQKNALLALRGPIAAEPYMPKDFPFYFPQGHRRIIEGLERSEPAAVIALTGRHPLCGLDPYPLFEDGALPFPTAYSAAKGPLAKALEQLVPGTGATIRLESHRRRSRSRQLIARRFGTAGIGDNEPGAPASDVGTYRAADQSRGLRIVITAHMDTKHGTPGALDNACGVSVMVRMMRVLRHAIPAVTLEFVPFNGEEYFAVPGQLAYLQSRTPTSDNTVLVVNIDGAGHRESKSAFSLYNADAALEECLDAVLKDHPVTTCGEQWIAGDHTIFAMAGIPCIAVTSSNLMETVIGLTHTPADTLETIDPKLLERTADCAAELVRRYTRLAYDSASRAATDATQT